MFAAVLLSLVFAGQQAEQKEVTYPVDTAWASSMMGKANRLDSVAWPEYKPIPACRFGPPNVFLVQGKDIREALTSTAYLCESIISMSRPARAGTVAKGAQFWLVADAGRGAPGFLEIESATRRDRRISIRFRTLRPVNVYSAWVYDRVWVPLGDLPPGDYELEFFRTDDRKPDLTRRVVIPAEKDR